MEQYIVTGMSCAACQARVEKAVSGLEGVDSCSVSLLTNSMGVEGSASPDEVIKAVEKAGYGASLKGEEKKESSANRYEAEEKALEDHETPVLKKRLLTSLVFLLVLMYVSMGHNMLDLPVPGFLVHNHIGLAVVQMLLAVIVMIINHKFFTSGFRSLAAKAPNMDTLVALGSMASFVWSVVVVLKMTVMITEGAANMDLMEVYHNELYFESAAMIPTLITVGKMLEAMSKGRTTNALKSLLKLAPKTAVLVTDGEEKTVDIDAVQVGDIFAVRPGESIPADGVVILGSSAVNESALTGESIPVEKTVNDTVSAGTINTSGYMQCRTTRVQGDTTLAQIIRMVSDAAATKAPIARIADTVSGYFVPFVIITALITAAGWLIAGQTPAFALARGISVLVISCPCALGLATPVAIMVGSGTGAKAGILFKTSESLENAGKIQVCALDKTGTITSGLPEVTDIHPAPGVSEEELLRYAYALERYSEHPLAKAITAEGEKRGLELLDAQDFKTTTGSGLSAVIDGKTVRGGSYVYICGYADIDAETDRYAQQYAETGKTPLFFARGFDLLGMIVTADVIKEDSARAVKELQKMGIEVVMLTGDNERTAKAIGELAGVDRVIAGVMPDGKEAVIRELQRKGRTAMVGDGINDAPALMRADTGIAIGAGTDVAIDSADIVLMNSRLTDVAAAVRLSRGVLRNIHENLFWAFFYNVICIPLAAGLFAYKMNPMVGAAAMSLSSFTVCMNALRLNRFKLYDPSHDRPVKYRNVKREEETAGDSLTVAVEGMMCEHCENAVETSLKKIKGIRSAEADHTAGSVVIYTDRPVSLDDIADKVKEAGYVYKGKK
ncbi:MAG: heavy metal translocating P-type ATPase [Solobacterium sp.]|nr:heavy metal translocating P-type ATPase [Solobacterium sp.]